MSYKLHTFALFHCYICRCDQLRNINVYIIFRIKCVQVFIATIRHYTRTHGRMHRRTHGRTHGRAHGRAHGRMHRWTHGRADGCADGRADGRAHARTHTHMTSIIHTRNVQTHMCDMNSQSHTQIFILT